MNYETILQEILESGKYLSLATVNADGIPWASPLSYQYDENQNSFYFISSPASRHIQNIGENPKVAFSIYNSTQTPGNAFGIQGSGMVERVDASDVPLLIRGALFSLVSMVVLNRPHEFYKIKVDAMFLPHAERWKEEKPFRMQVHLKNISSE